MNNNALRQFTILIILVFPSLVNASSTSLLKCLGLEEERYHLKKITNARSKLNTEIINDLAQTGELNLKDEYFQIICHKNEPHPAERLLEMQLLHATELFDFYGDNKEIKRALLLEYQKSLPQLFLRHLGNLQSELSGPNCLDQKIPELKKIKEKIKYTEEEISHNVINTLKKEIQKTFKMIKNFQKLKTECRIKNKTS